MHANVQLIISIRYRVMLGIYIHTKGGGSLQRMNRDEFLQRISVANLEGSTTAEEAGEALMRAITDACDASIPRRPPTYHRGWRD